MLKVVEVARQAATSGDFELIKSNLSVLSDYLKDQKNGLSPNDKNLINQTMRNLNFIVNKENSRRTLISDKTKKYEAASNKLKKCDELFEFYNIVLNDPAAQSYTYSTSPSNETEETLKDFFESVKEALGLTSTPTNLADLKAKVAEVEKVMDDSAFAINKANGVYDEKISAQDLARAQELARDKKKIDDTKAKRAALKKELKSKVSAADYNKYTGKGKVKEIEDKIKALEAKPFKKRSKDDKDLLRILQGLKSLSVIKEFGPAKNKELSAIYSKYGVSSIEELTTVLSEHEVENSHENDNTTGITPADFAERVDNSYVTPSEGKRVVNTLSVKDVGETLDEATNALRQRGYAPCAGKESFVYARPVFKKSFGIFVKPEIQSMELVEESIESILKNPERAYSQAIRELQTRAKAFESGTEITTENIKQMNEAFKALIKDGRYDEAVKRIISAKSTMTRTDLANFVTQHIQVKDSANNPITVPFPGGDENYKAPHIPAIRKSFGRVDAGKPELDKPSDAIVQSTLNDKFLRYQPANRGTGPVVSRNVVHDRTHHKDDRDERD